MRYCQEGLLQYVKVRSDILLTDWIWGLKEREKSSNTKISWLFYRIDIANGNEEGRPGTNDTPSLERTVEHTSWSVTVGGVGLEGGSTFRDRKGGLGIIHTFSDPKKLWDFMSSPKGSTHREKSKGLKTEPWETPKGKREVIFCLWKHWPKF